MDALQTRAVHKCREELLDVLRLNIFTASTWFRDNHVVTDTDYNMLTAARPTQTPWSLAEILMYYIMDSENGWEYLTKYLAKTGNDEILKQMLSAHAPQRYETVYHLRNHETSSTGDLSNHLRNHETSSTGDLSKIFNEIKIFYKQWAFIPLNPRNPPYYLSMEQMWVNLQMSGPPMKNNVEMSGCIKMLEPLFAAKQVVLLHGKPGTGKSTWVKKVCYDWAMCRSNFKYDLLLVADLGELTTAPSNCPLPVDLALQFLSQSQYITLLSNEEQRANFKRAILSGNYRILVVLDGLEQAMRDVLSKGCLSFLWKMQQDSWCYDLIITARSDIALTVTSSVVTLVRNEGFSTESVKKFVAITIRKMQEMAPSSSKDYREMQIEDFLLNKIIVSDKHDSAVKLAHVPLMLQMMCWLACQESSFLYQDITSATTLVDHFFDHLHGEVYSNGETDKCAANWRFMTETNLLGRIAYECLFGTKRYTVLPANVPRLDDKQMLDFAELGILLHNSTIVPFGSNVFMKPNPEPWTVKFCHRYFQEYFAALFLCQMNVLHVRDCFGAIDDRDFYTTGRQLLLFYASLVTDCSALIHYFETSMLSPCMYYDWDECIGFLCDIIENCNDTTNKSPFLNQLRYTITNYLKAIRKIPLNYNMSTWQQILTLLRSGNEDFVVQSIDTDTAKLMLSSPTLSIYSCSNINNPAPLATIVSNECTSSETCLWLYGSANELLTVLSNLHGNLEALRLDFSGSLVFSELNIDIRDSSTLCECKANYVHFNFRHLFGERTKRIADCTLLLNKTLSLISEINTLHITSCGMAVDVPFLLENVHSIKAMLFNKVTFQPTNFSSPNALLRHEYLSMAMFHGCRVDISEIINFLDIAPNIKFFAVEECISSGDETADPYEIDSAINALSRTIYKSRLCSVTLCNSLDLDRQSRLDNILEGAEQANETVKELGLNKCALTDHQVDYLVKIVLKFIHLELLWLFENDFSREKKISIRNVCFERGISVGFSSNHVNDD